jgi:hypothetical protein
MVSTLAWLLRWLYIAEIEYMGHMKTCVCFLASIIKKIVFLLPTVLVSNATAACASCSLDGFLFFLFFSHRGMIRNNFCSYFVWKCPEEWVYFSCLFGQVHDTCINPLPEKGLLESWEPVAKVVPVGLSVRGHLCYLAFYVQFSILCAYASSFFAGLYPWLFWEIWEFKVKAEVHRSISVEFVEFWSCQQFLAQLIN